MERPVFDIELSGVGLQRGHRWILRHIDWRVPRGACAAILGPNGSGKSTLARMIAAHLWPTEGRCSVLGSRFGESDLPTLRQSIRLLQPDGPCDIGGDLTTREVVLSGFFGTLALYDRPTRSMRMQAGRAINLVGLSAVADHPYATLSSGERVRSLIARALVGRPRMLLLDEPTAGLDLLAREQVLATIQAMFDNGRPAPTTVIITHHVEELPPATSSVLLLHEGRCAAAGPPHRVLRPPLLSRVYGCPVKVRRCGGRHYLHLHPKAWPVMLR